MTQTAQKDSDDAEGRGKALGEHIRGTFGTALGEQMGVNTKSLRAFSESLAGLANAYTSGAQKLAPAVQGLRDVLQDAQSQGFTVSDDWKLQDTQRPNMHRAQAQEQLQPRLSSALTALDQADHETMGDIAKARQALYESPMPQLGLGQTPNPQQPPAQPDQPQPDDKQHDQGQPGDHVPGANAKPGDPGYVVPKAPGDPADYPSEPGWKSDVPGADNPPGYPPTGPGAQRDQNWKDYLAGKNPDGSLRPKGEIPAAYPNPESVSDKGLKVIGAAARQQGTRYVWGGGGPNGTSQPGTRDSYTDRNGVFHQGFGDSRHDYEHKGFDCSGLAEYSVFQATGYDPDHNSGAQLSKITSGANPAGVVVPPSEAQPGDLVYYGPKGSEHVAIYMGNGVTVETNTSGTPVHMQTRSSLDDGRGITVVHLK
ncbi:C40 family peptidase [Segniliparus rotundus]|nr:NlpC/P60 family protein [Segniliparus rotundus]